MAERFNQPVPQHQAQPNRFDLDIADDQYIDGRQLKEIVNRFANAPAPTDPVARQLAAMNAFGLVKLEYADDFKKWESEIRSEAGKLPVEYWNVDTLSQLVRIVRSNHVDELVAEKAQRLANESHPTIRSGSGGSGSVPNKTSIFESGSPELLSRLRAAQITTEAELREACKGTGIEPAQFLAELEKGAIVRG